MTDTPLSSTVGLEPARLGERSGSRFGNHLGNLGSRLGGLATGSHNVGKAERWMSALGGAALAALALRRRSRGAIGLAALAGVPLLVRGATGHCAFYQALGIDRGPEAGNGTTSASGTASRFDSTFRTGSLDVNPPAPLTPTASPGTPGLLGPNAQDETGRDPIGQNF